MPESLKNMNIWITGASSGIGSDLLELLLNQNANVFATSRNLENLRELQQRYPGNLHLIAADVADMQSVQNCIQQISARVSHLDKIILNAGVCYYLDMPNFKADIFKQNFSVNFFGIVNCIEQAYTLLKAAEKPHIIGMSSAVAYLPIPRAEAYGASKAAVLYMLRAMQAHQLDKKMYISIICPGFVLTPLTQKNTFPMPFLLSSKLAATYILKGIIKYKTEISFPLRLIWLFKLIAFLPDRLRIGVMSMAVKRQ